MDRDTLNTITQAFFFGARTSRLIAGYPEPSDDEIVGLVDLLKRIEAGDASSIDSANQGTVAQENRRLERQLATIILGAMPPDARRLT